MKLALHCVERFRLVMLQMEAQIFRQHGAQFGRHDDLRNRTEAQRFVRVSCTAKRRCAVRPQP